MRESIASDIHDMAPRLRICDKAEIVASTGEKPVVALGRGFANSEKCWTVEYMGRPAAMFGIVPVINPEYDLRLGGIWLLGTDDIPLFNYRFLAESKKWLSLVSEGYDVVGNLVDARNLKHIKWLKWMGFVFHRTIPEHGHLKLPFHEFSKVV